MTLYYLTVGLRRTVSRTVSAAVHMEEKACTQICTHKIIQKLYMTKINKSKRVTVQIPIGTAVHEYLLKNNNVTQWQLLDELVNQTPKSKEERALLVFEEFVEKMSQLCPECKKQIEFLRPLILRRIMKKETLDSWYYEDLKKL